MSPRTRRPAAVASAAARLAYGLLQAGPPGGAAKWTRTNHRGEPITLLEGPAVAIGAVAGALAADGSARDRLAIALARPPERPASAAMTTWPATAAAAVSAVTWEPCVRAS